MRRVGELGLTRFDDFHKQEGNDIDVQHDPRHF